MARKILLKISFVLTIVGLHTGLLLVYAEGIAVEEYNTRILILTALTSILFAFVTLFSILFVQIYNSITRIQDSVSNIKNSFENMSQD